MRLAILLGVIPALALAAPTIKDVPDDGTQTLCQVLFSENSTVSLSGTLMTDGSVITGKVETDLYQPKNKTLPFKNGDFTIRGGSRHMDTGISGLDTNVCVDTDEYNLAMLFANWEISPPGNSYNLEGLSVQMPPSESSSDEIINAIDRVLLFPVKRLLASAKRFLSLSETENWGDQALNPCFFTKVSDTAEKSALKWPIFVWKSYQCLNSGWTV